MNISKFFLCLLWWMIPITAFCQTKELDRLADDAAKAARKGNFALTDSLYGEYVRLFREQDLEKNFQYSEILIYLAQRAAQKGHSDEAIEIQQEVVEVLGQLLTALTYRRPPPLVTWLRSTPGRVTMTTPLRRDRRP